MSNQRTLFLIAGEPSGDTRGAELIRALKKEDPSLRFEGLGGSKMRAEGMKLLFDLPSLAAIGFGDVIRQYSRIRQIFYQAIHHVKQTKPAAIILIDYPGFNLRFAKKMKKEIPVLYYISPQIWAWGMRRMAVIKRFVTRMLVLFKFEEKMYQDAGMPVTWVGHPLVESVKTDQSKADLRRTLDLEVWEKVVALLPGSRETEVRRILPVVLESAVQISQKHPDFRFLLSETSNVSKSIYEDILKPYKTSLKLICLQDRMHDILFASDAAIVASGTATLETALTLIPFVIVYKTAWSTYTLGKRLIRIPFIGMVNIIGGHKIISEFIQHDAVPENIANEICMILENEDIRMRILEQLKEVKEKLGPPGAPARAAQAILACLNRS
ncbi:MAG: lipid-A-disaccharide synthase [Candidatus Omnitrophica bacterium CG11_big_fil_rev_8_21_14_0_20_45_26]|uniref:Lipid-A-disaccharide synthase n=1 Tax=Candidatus Abzuiibacterium crystallinum TaxID=1974748 RepID=A0A2H0LUM7_9BACT|nr:MAG: lipid-A-disaccharide synthase [Candidatus Omnitrophica bacterium CG11_big_fil_rev_8_21_14_0_20_45_26]PIW64171.1 MAG: lipid-A-disaccharide synthase [Candidatus Omnitrophica bacterium CG12_big_fil_rev_8_21_14_0_65_45_16]